MRRCWGGRPGCGRRLADGATAAALARAAPLPLAEAAHETIEVAPARRLHAAPGGMAAAPEGRLGDPALARLLATEAALPAARLHVLDDVLVHAGSWTVFKAGRPVLETVPGWRRGDLAGFLELPRLAADWAAGVTAEHAGPVICGANAPHRNYAHWHMDCLAGMVLAREAAGPAPRILLPRALAPFQRDSLALLGEAVAVLPATGLVRCRRLLWPSTLEALAMAGAHAGAAFARIGAALGAGGEAGGRLYLARFDAGVRRAVADEQALAGALGGLGFRVVTPGALPFAEQVRAAARASVILGPHGAGLTNAGYARPGTMLVELHPQGYGAAAFARLAMQRGLAWRGWIMPVDGQGHDARAVAGIPALLAQLRAWGVA